VPRDLPKDTITKRLDSAGAFGLNNVQYMVGGRHGFQHVSIIAEGDQPDDKVTVTDLDGEILIEHRRPAPGIAYAGSGAPHTTPRPSSSPVCRAGLDSLSPASARRRE